MAFFRTGQKQQTIQTRIQLFTRPKLFYRQRERYLYTQLFFGPAKESSTQNQTRRGRRSTRRQHSDDNSFTGRTNIVFNISSQSLAPAELDLLQKGLSFCPTPPFDTFLLEQELQRFYRTLRLKVHFSTKGEHLDVPIDSHNVEMFSLRGLQLRIPSHFQPPRTYHHVETYIDLVQKDINRCLHMIKRGDLHNKNNLNPEESMALSTLKKRQNLIIKPADKGGAIVIMDRTYYISEIHTQLNDRETYLPISQNPTSEVANLIKNLVTCHSQMGTIDTKLSQFLVNNDPIMPVFYTLPKIHKNLHKPPGRPIVASTNSILSPLAITLEKILTPHIHKIASYIKDTAHFLTSIKDLGIIPNNSILTTMDVNNLYTSIDHEEGIEATKKFLRTHTTYSVQQIDFCKDLLTLVLTKNFFMFEDRFYFQKRGTAMGSNMAPPYANIFMDKFENDYVYTHPLFDQYVLFWKRFIDDIFFIWTGTENDLKNFFSDLNTRVTSLKFTILQDSHSIHFLDTWITLTDTGHLISDLYIKPTDKNSLLLYSSCHPRHVKRALPKSQHNRVDRIVSDVDTKKIRHEEMNVRFRQRGYPPYILNQSTQPNTKRKEESRLVFVSTYHPFGGSIIKCIKKHWPLLGQSYPEVLEFSDSPLLCHRRPRNIRDHLIKADVGSTHIGPIQRTLATPRRGTFPCLGCLQCSNVTKGDTFTHPLSGKRFPIKEYFSCDSTYVVYLIKCPCGLGYVGETTQHIRDRISQHKSTIRCRRTMLPIPAHFLAMSHGISQLRYQVIDHIPPHRRGGNRIKKLKKRELYWIHTLQTLTPKGLNREYEVQYD
ncbi:uncharacterized protein [Phyllobates terribilis]|uniref:uncharacterized protein n=1 Tax=Phyllobates terribilis TaxID=111132 RepID=UPI003CCA8D54